MIDPLKIDKTNERINYRMLSPLLSFTFLLIIYRYLTCGDVKIQYFSHIIFDKIYHIIITFYIRYTNKIKSNEMVIFQARSY